MAERVGFEPTKMLPPYRFSRAASSTTPAPLHTELILTEKGNCLKKIDFCYTLFMDKITIRQIEIGDEIDLNKNVFPTENEEDIRKSVEKDVKSMSKNNKWIYLVAVLNGEVVGTTYLKLSNESYCNRHIAELYTVVVGKKFQRRGVCRELINESVKIAKENNLEKIILSVREGTIADTVYQKLGFTCYGRLPNGIKDKNEYFNQKQYYLDIKV